MIEITGSIYDFKYGAQFNRQHTSVPIVAVEASNS